MLFPSIETREVKLLLQMFHRIQMMTRIHHYSFNTSSLFIQQFFIINEEHAFQTTTYRDGMRLIFLLYPLIEVFNYQGYSYYVRKLDWIFMSVWRIFAYPSSVHNIYVTSWVSMFNEAMFREISISPMEEVLLPSLSQVSPEI